MIFNWMLKGDLRTVKARKNIVVSIGLKIIDSITYFLLVPATIKFLNPYEFGVWLALSSILMWIDSFDIGLGNGMRNKLALCLAKDDTKRARIYVSTTFFMLIVLVTGFVLVYTLARPFIDWNSILNAPVSQVPHLNEIVYLSFILYCINFIFKIIGSVYLAMQLSAVNNFLIVSGHVLALFVIFILSEFTEGTLLLTAVIYTSAPLIVYLIAYPITFKIKYKSLSPSIKCIDKECLGDLFNIGMHFFILQISGIVLFSLVNLLISHELGPETVTQYSVAYRYYSVVLMCMNLILAPMWSATTDAYAMGDMKWIQNTMAKIRKVLLIATVGIVFMTFVSEWFYKIWVGSEVEIGISVSVPMAIYVWIIMCSLTYSNFLNGLGKLRLQMINTLCMAIVYLPFCYYLGSVLGLPGIIIGMCVLNLSGFIFNYIQFNKIINGTADGIWDR